MYNFIGEIQSQRKYELLFEIDHIDAHADLGMGDASYKYISSEILFRQLDQRYQPEKINGLEGLSAGNFLTFLIANRWIKSLTYVNRKEWSNDVPLFIFKDFDINSGLIQLKKYTPAQIKRMIDSGELYRKSAENEPVGLEPEVPIRVVDFNAFKSDGKYDYVFLTSN